jgi:hypothetical protein
MKVWCTHRTKATHPIFQSAVTVRIQIHQMNPFYKFCSKERRFHFIPRLTPDTHSFLALLFFIFIF